MKPKRLLRGILVLGLMTTFAAPVVGPAAGQEAPALWSDPATWGGATPAEGAVVTIPAGQTVLLDVSPPPLGGLRVEGALIFDEQDLELSAEWIVLAHPRARFQIGAPGARFRHRAVVTLTDRIPGEEIDGMGDKVLGVAAGRLDLHGEDRGPGWTRLVATAAAGDDRLVLEAPGSWRPGDRLVIASTDFDPYQAEEAVVAAVDGNIVTLEAPLASTHWGEDQRFGETTLSERAEVGLLTRNVVIQGDDGSETEGLGGHLMVMGGLARIEGVELTRMGQAGKLARYPIHFHLLGDLPGAYVRDSSIHHTFNRCLTIHGTNDVHVEGNVAFNALGHCFFLEDGVETGNRFVRNLGVLTRTPEEGKRLLPSDAQPSTFWITNPANEFIENVAAGSDAIGFWFALPEHPTGLSASAATEATVWPRRTPLGSFRGNVAHSNGFRGLNVDDGPTPDGNVEVTSYDPVVDPIPRENAYPPAVEARFESFTAYKNRERAVWLRGSHLRLVDARLADNGIGATFAAYETTIEDSLIVGESANLGTPSEGDPAGSDGRALPFPWEPGFPIRGYEFYDGIVGARNVAFAAFHPNETRHASGLGFNRQNPFPLDPRSFAEGLVWLDDSNRVLIEDPLPENDGDKTALFRDRDGSVTGRAGRAVVVETALLHDGSCVAEAAWNAVVCDGQYAQLGIEDASDEPQRIGPIAVWREDGAGLRLAGLPTESEGAPAVSFNVSLLTERAYDVLPIVAPDRLRLTLRGEAGDWVRLTIPYAGSELFVYDGYNVDPDGALERAVDVAGVDAATGGAYSFDGRTLTLRLQIPPDSDTTARMVCVREGCA